MTTYGILPALRGWLDGDDRSPREVDADVREELEYHLAALAAHFEETGMSADEARSSATEQFGDVERYAAECRKIDLANRAAVRRALLAAVAVLVVAVVYLGQGLSRSQSNLQTLQAQFAVLSMQVAASKRSIEKVTLAQATASTAAVKMESLTGKVAGVDGQPLADAKVVLILKTWPHNRYRQRDYALSTDADGKFVLENSIPVGEQWGVNVEVLAPGHAFVSRYLLVERGASTPPQPMAFQLQPGKTVKVKFVDASGKPLRDFSVAPSERSDAQGEQVHGVYHQGSEKLASIASRGNEPLSIDWFQAGDRAKLYVTRSDGDVTEASFDVPTSSDEATIVIGD